MRRLALVAAVATLALAPAAPAAAHTGDTDGVSDYRVTVTGVSAPERGLGVRLVDGGRQLELRNDTGHAVEVLGYSGEPYLEIRPDGVYENGASPTAYLNKDAAVPAGADPTAAPSWRRISTGTTARWHDQRTEWLAADLPPQVAADPDSRHRVRDWAVPLRAQARAFEIRGTLDYEPPPRAWLWWAGAALLGLAVTGLARRLPGSIAPVALFGAITTLGYALARILDGGGRSGVLVLAGLFAAGVAYRRPPFYLTLAGFVLCAFAGFGSSAVLDAAVVPSAGPDWLARVAMVIAVGVGGGLALTGVLRMRGAQPERAPTASV